MQVHLEHGEHQAQVGRDGRLPGEQHLHAGLDAHAQPIDLVVEGDDVVGELGIARLQRGHRATERAQDELSLLLEVGFELCELFLEGGSHPKRPVT